MTKKVLQKNKVNFPLTRHRCLFVLLFIVLLSVQTSFAADVAYIYKNKLKIDNNVLKVFSDMNLSVDLISEKNLSQNFSKFKFIYVGNERFSNYRKIPVSEFPFVITNYFFGFQWGLTDRDGVSKLGGTSPLSVVKDGELIQIYTKSRYNNSQISIPYFYLGRLDKAPGMEKVAGTYSKDGFDLGDVISFADINTRLINGKYTKGKLCFYGISESKYWTNEAKELFKECIESVAVECSENSQCGSDEFGENYCLDNDVYKNVTRHICVNPGTVHSRCVSEIIELKVQNCSSNQICQNGSCVEQIIECRNSSDCGTDGFIGNPFCQDNDVYQSFLSYSCVNPGTPQSYCSNSTSLRLKQSCSSNQICQNGSCVEQIIECRNNSDCDDGNVYTYDQCNNPGTPQSYCSHTPMNCVVDNDCGITGFIGSEFCSGNSVYKNFQNSTCVNPGTIFSYCNIFVEQRLLKTCSSNQICQNGSCVEDEKCEEARNILDSIYSVINGSNNYGIPDQGKIFAFCNNDDFLMAGAGEIVRCSDSNLEACNYNTNYEYNGPVPFLNIFKNGWESKYSLENQNAFYDTVREEAICIPKNFSKYFSLYIKVKGDGKDPYSLDQNNNEVFCDPGDKVISGGGYAPYCDSNNPACNRKQYLEFNGRITVGDQEGWRTDYDLGGNEVYDTVQTFAICLKKTILFDQALKIYSVVNQGSNLYSLDQNRTKVFCNPGDIAVGGGGNGPYCDNPLQDPACNKIQFLEFNRKIKENGREGWMFGLELNRNEIYDTQRINVVCIGVADKCV